MVKLLLSVFGAVLLAICLLVAFGGLRALASSRPPLRGELVDIGGRRLRIVCEGPRSDLPLVVTESGIFGFAADWGVVQTRLAAEGVRSCAYDRAGLGYSDPGPEPRDGLAIVSDLEKLLAAHGESGPVILVAHSMAGLHTRLFALRNPSRVKGLVLVDAASPERVLSPQGRDLFRKFDSFADWVVRLSQLGVLRAISPWNGDSIGLEGAARREKIYFFGDTRFNKAGAAETHQAARAAEQALAAGKLDPALPVAVVTEAVGGGRRMGWAKGRADAATASRHGFIHETPGATHADLLGRKHASVIVQAVNEVASAAGYPQPSIARPAS